jgi:hypothetical protein
LLIFNFSQGGNKKNTMGSNSDSISYQLPVVIAAKTVVVNTVIGRIDDDHGVDDAEITTFKGSTTIASGDFDVDIGDRNDDVSKLVHNPDSSTNPPEPPFVIHTFVEFLISLFLSLLLKPLFGSLYIIRSLFFGYILNYCMRLVSVTERATEQWISPMHLNAAAAITPCTVAMNIDKGLSSQSSWPPTTLIVLAVLTIVALIVHPDGYTWIIMYKVRYVQYSKWSVGRLSVNLVLAFQGSYYNCHS